MSEPKKRKFVEPKWGIKHEEHSRFGTKWFHTVYHYTGNDPELEGAIKVERRNCKGCGRCE